MIDSFRLPPLTDLPVTRIETPAILRKVAVAGRQLAELKGVVASVPNPAILINSLGLQEAKDSSAIENIVTTHDDLYRESLFPEYDNHSNTDNNQVAAKEVRHYVQALKAGFDLVRVNQMLTNNHIVQMQRELEKNNAGFRKLPGTALKNSLGETVYTPPQDPETIIHLMSDLERFINDDELFLDIDPLVKMAIIHYQFESIHPFYDGNGRTGRIINVLYLVQKGLLDVPILYLSRYIVRTKSDYYRLLQSVRDSGNWEEWILYMLVGIEETARETIQTVTSIQTALTDYKRRIRADYKFYSQDLINSLFMHPYTKIEFIERDLGVSRVTAMRYLDLLSEGGFLSKHKMSRSNYYINDTLYRILTDKR
jgi:Fic family protein